MKHFSELTASAERVVDAAQGLIQERGYNGFSYDDVAKLIGIKKPSIHHHFATKGDLVATVAQRYTHRFGEQLLNIEERQISANKKLIAYAALFEQTFQDSKRFCLCGMLGTESGTLPDIVNTEVQRFFAQNIDWLTGIVRAGQKDGDITNTSSASAIGRSYLCLLEGAMVVGRGGYAKASPAQIAATFLHAISN